MIDVCRTVYSPTIFHVLLKLILSRTEDTSTVISPTWQRTAQENYYSPEAVCIIVWAAAVTNRPVCSGSNVVTLVCSEELVPQEARSLCSMQSFGDLGCHALRLTDPCWHESCSQMEGILWEISTLRHRHFSSGQLLLGRTEANVTIMEGRHGSGWAHRRRGGQTLPKVRKSPNRMEPRSSDHTSHIVSLHHCLNAPLAWFN